MTTKSRTSRTAAPTTPEQTKPDAMPDALKDRMNGGHPPAPTQEPTPNTAPTAPEPPTLPPVPPNTEPGTNGQEAASFNWSTATKADAVREASKILGGERSPAAILKWLKTTHGITVESPQASGVLKKMYAEPEPAKLDEGSVKLGIKAIRAVDKYAASVGGLVALEEQIENCIALVQFANTLGGLEMLRSIISEMKDEDAAE